MNIYIPIEIKARELEGRVLLALAAAERGHLVIVGEKKDTIVKASKGQFPPGLVHMKSITPHKSMLESLHTLKKKGHNITVQDEESGLLDESYDTFARLRFSEETIELVDRVCTWGHYDHRSLEKMYADLGEHFSVTGSPRVDFWRKDFHDYYSNIEDAETIKGKPYLMVVSNFSGPLNVNRFWDIMARLNKAGYFAREEGREKHEFENAAYQTRLIGEFVFLIRDLARTYPDHNILVRPHPVESIEGWRKLIGEEVSNVIVEREGTISRWIRHAKVIIHNGCTSALEAAIAGENRIAYRPIPFKFEREIPNKVSLNAYSIEEVKSFISDLLKGENLHRKDQNFEEIQSLVNDRFEAIDDKLAADRIVDVWDEISKSNSSENTPEDFLNLSYQGNPSVKKQIKKTVKNVRDTLTLKSNGSKSKRLLKSYHKFPEFTDEEMSGMHMNLRNTLKRFEKVTCKRLGRKSFLMYNKEKY